MRFRLMNTVLCAHYGQLLPIAYYIEEINLVLHWADATGRVQP